MCDLISSKISQENLAEYFISNAQNSYVTDTLDVHEFISNTMLKMWYVFYIFLEIFVV